MRTIIRIRTVLFIYCLVTPVKWSHAASGVELDLRVTPDSGAQVISCKLKNRSGEGLNILPITYGSNHFFGKLLNGSGFDNMPLSRPLHRDDTFRINIPDNERYCWMVDISVVDNPFVLGRQRGIYHRLQWHVAEVRTRSNYITVGFAKGDGTMSSPVIGSGEQEITQVLAFVFNEGNVRDIAFLFFNGTEEAVTVEEPLREASRIVATSPAIDYTRELFLADQASELIEIEAGEVGEWRIPWSTIRDLIPEADLAAIKEGGGDLDLVWKVDYFQSAPLPLSLSDPPSDDD